MNQEARERSVLSALAGEDPDESLVRVIHPSAQTIILHPIPGSAPVQVTSASQPSVSDILNKIDLSSILGATSVPAPVAAMQNPYPGYAGYQNGYPYQPPYQAQVPPQPTWGQPHGYAEVPAQRGWTAAEYPNRDEGFDRGRRGEGKKRLCRFWVKGE